jgi:predicted nucleic acid-binding protein
MSLVVDASVASLWFLGERRSSAALRIVEERSESLIAPDLLPIEVANALWNARRSASKAIAIRPVLEQLANLITYEPSTRLLVAASAIARSLDHPIYDCLYAALVEQGGHSMITADQKLFRKLHKTRFAPNVELLTA